MSVKFPMKNEGVQSLYGLAWTGKLAGSENAVDPLFSGYAAAREDEASDEGAILDGELVLRNRGIMGRDDLEVIKKGKSAQSEREMHLFWLGYTGL